MIISRGTSRTMPVSTHSPIEPWQAPMLGRSPVARRTLMAAESYASMSYHGSRFTS